MVDKDKRDNTPFDDDDERFDDMPLEEEIPEDWREQVEQFIEAWRELGIDEIDGMTLADLEQQLAKYDETERRCKAAERKYKKARDNLRRASPYKYSKHNDEEEGFGRYLLDTPKTKRRRRPPKGTAKD